MKIGRYEVVRKLANGGMAEVFLAKVAGPLGFEKTLVLKRILPHLASEPSFVEMFLAEAKLVAQLNHPHIIQIFDFGETDGAYFLAMEYIDGPNLRTLLKRTIQLGTPLSPALCAKIVALACEGLAYAHDFRDPASGQPLGLIHRDISPDNILLSRQGAVKIADFGIAKTAGRGQQTREGILKGKLCYLAPEQFRSLPPDRRIDVYALGVVLYELLTGRRPFDATTDASLMKAILFEPPIPAAARRPDLPETLLRILDRVLAKEREERYPDCLALQVDLDRFVLSTGESLGSLHIARLITQLEPAAEAPPAPPPLPAEALAANPEVPTIPTNALRAIRQGETVDLRPPKQLEPTAHLKPVAGPDEAASFEESLRARGRRQVLALALGTMLFVSGGGYALFHSRAISAPEPWGGPRPEVTDAWDVPDAGPDLDGGTDGGIGPDGGTDGGTYPDERPSPPPPDPVPTRPEPDARKAGQGKGTVEFRIHPFATVILDGKELGMTPFPPIKLSAGRHTVRLINTERSKDVTRTLVVKPGQLNVFKFNFDKD
jgi:serine/threonine-protein kinase